MASFQVFFLTLQKVAFLLTVVWIGYLFCRRGKVDRKAAGALSLLTTHVFAPCYYISTLSQSFTVEKLGSDLTVLGGSLLLLFPSLLLARLLAKRVSRNDFEKRSLIYVFAFANTGYFGYPVIQGVFGDELLSRFMVFCIPFNLAIQSYGYALFSADGKRADWKKAVFSPGMIAYYISIFMGLSGISARGFARDVLSGLGACMSPVSMLSVGIVLGAFGLKELLSGVRPYLFSLTRLVLIPLIFGLPLSLIGLRGADLILPVAALAMPVGLNSVVFPENFGYDASENARLCFVSFLLSILTLPAAFALASAGAGL